MTELDFVNGDPHHRHTPHRHQLLFVTTTTARQTPQKETKGSAIINDIVTISLLLLSLTKAASFPETDCACGRTKLVFQTKGSVRSTLSIIMFHTIWSHSRSRHTTTAVLSALSGTTAVATLLASTTTSPLFDDGNNRAVARCEEAAEHDDPPPSDGSKPYRPPQRAGTQFFTQYFAGGGGGEGGRQRHSEAASGIGGGRQEGPADGPSGGGAFVTRVRPKSRPFCPPWDFNWDGRQTEASSPATMATRRGFHASRELGNVRHIILVRHGQYHEEFKDDRRRVLTPLGRHQAELTGQRLAVMLRGGLGMIDPGFAGPCNIKAIHVSDMTRAKETAQIIASHLPGVQQMPPDPLLNEALPAE